jgi:hypothetical protein
VVVEEAAAAGVAAGVAAAVAEVKQIPTLELRVMTQKPIQQP